MCSRVEEVMELYVAFTDAAVLEGAAPQGRLPQG